MLSELPERLLLVLLWTSVVVACLTVAGLYHRLIVLPMIVAVVAVTWRWHPPPVPRRRGDLLAVAACLLLLATWAGVQVGLTGERVLVSRDPDIYTLTALWLVDHPNVSIPIPDGSVGVLGFDPARGALQPQGTHLVPAMSAMLGWAWGIPGVLAANLLWGAFGLLGLFALGRRLLGAAASLIPVAALALSLPMIDFSRSMYSEPLPLALTMLGGTLLLAAWESGRSRDFLLCGVALGAVSLARLDGALLTIGVVAGLTALAAVTTGLPDVPGRRWGSALVAAGATPLAVVGALDISLYTVAYSDASRPLLVGLAALGLIVVAGSSVLASSARRGSHQLERNARLIRVAAAPAAVLLMALWVVLVTRPWWLVARDDAANPAVASLQATAGVPVEPRQSYAENTLIWLSWYYGVIPVAVGLLVLTAWLLLGLRNARHARLACLLLLVLPSTLLYVWSPLISPDQVWAVRRFLPVVIPGLLLATVWGLRALAAPPGRAQPLRQTAAALLALTVVAWPAATIPGLWSVRDKGGALAGVQQVCDEVAGRPTVVTGNDTLLPTILVMCDVPAYGIRVEPSTSRLAAAHRALGGGDVALVTRDPAGLSLDREVAWAPLNVQFTTWEPTLLRRPKAGAVQGTLVSVGSVEPDGTVTPGTRR